MTITTLKTFTKLLTLCQNEETIYIGDFHGNVFKLDRPYKNYTLVENFDEPVSAIAILKNKLIVGTWKGNIIYEEEKIMIEEGIINALKVYRDQLFIAVNTTLYVYIEQKIKYKIDTTHKINSITIHNNSLYCGLNLPFIGIVNFYNEIPVYELLDSYHQAGITAIQFINSKCTHHPTIKQSYVRTK